jgi:Domain of unknown function (DUF5615)
MRVLLDERVPRALRNDLPGHEVKTVAELGWAGVQNGELLRRAAAAFDLLITVDRNLEYSRPIECREVFPTVAWIERGEIRVQQSSSHGAKRMRNSYHNSAPDFAALNPGYTC